MSNTDDTKQVAGDDRERVPNASETGGPIILFFYDRIRSQSRRGVGCFPPSCCIRRKNSLLISTMSNIWNWSTRDVKAAIFSVKTVVFPVHRPLPNASTATKKSRATPRTKSSLSKLTFRKIGKSPWLIYSKQPQCVYFSHVAHVKMGEYGLYHLSWLHRRIHGTSDLRAESHFPIQPQYLGKEHRWL